MDYSAAVAFFDSDGPYLLSTHLNADGDGIGALLALGEMLGHLGRPYRIVLSGETVDQKLAFLPGFDRIERYGCAEDRRHAACAVFADTPTVAQERVGDVAEMIGPETRTLIIDHHNPEPGNERHTYLVDSEASAASEMVYRLILAAGMAVSPEMATQIYAGIVFDTKLFKYSNPKRALKICAELVDFGADPQRIADALFAHQTYETVWTLGMALSSLTLHLDKQVSSLLVDHPTYVKGGDLDPVVDHAMSIDGVEVALFLKEEKPGRFRVSLRSRGTVDVNEIAQIFGGGGHRNASGCTIEAPLEDARGALLAELEKRMTSDRL